MQDRIPTFPGRVTLTPVSGQTNTYDMARADEPTQEGTPLNKATLLKDATAETLGLSGDPTVDDAFAAMSAVAMPTIQCSVTTGSVVTCTNGTRTVTGTSVDGVCTLRVPEYGTYTISATLNGETSKVYTVTVDTTKLYTANITFAKIYGVEWDGTAATTWSRTDDSALFANPTPYLSGATSYGSPFDELEPWSGMVRVTDSEAGELVAIPKFWYKWTKNGTVMKLQIADRAADGYHVSPAHMDRGDGKGERDIVYVGRYHCGATAYKSASGQKPNVSITRSTARTNIAKLGDTIWQSDFAMRVTIWMLYLVEFADWNSQNVIGYGCGDNSAITSMGYTDSMPYHTGTTKTARTTYGYGTQYRYIEGLWDNVYDWGDGCYYNSSGLNIILNPNNFSDSSGGTAVGVPTGGYPSAFAVPTISGLEWAIYPTASAGSTSTYTADGWGFGSSNPCLYFGGAYNQNLNRGLFCVNYSSASSAVGDIGCRLQKLP